MATKMDRYVTLARGLSLCVCGSLVISDVARCSPKTNKQRDTHTHTQACAQLCVRVKRIQKTEDTNLTWKINDACQAKAATATEAETEICLSSCLVHPPLSVPSPAALHLEFLRNANVQRNPKRDRDKDKDESCSRVRL